ncbi:MAG: hypothetical protein ACYTG5_23500 [Planctomycetota bacterium]|jgi:penicillin-binding protein 1A
MNVKLEGARAKGGIKGRLFRWILFIGATVAVGSGLAGLILYAVMSRDIPDFSTLDDYRPKLVTRIFAQDGQLIGELFREKRTPRSPT